MNKKQEQAYINACQALIVAYHRAEHNGSIDWSDVDYAHELAIDAIDMSHGISKREQISLTNSET